MYPSFGSPGNWQTALPTVQTNRENTGNKVANSAKLNDRSNSRCKTSFGNKNITCNCWREKKPHELHEERTRESCMTRFITSCDQMSLPCTTTNCSVNRLQERQLLLTDRHLLQDTGSNESWILSLSEETRDYVTVRQSCSIETDSDITWSWVIKKPKFEGVINDGRVPWRV